MEAQLKEIILANPRGFCAGVDRAIAIVEIALEKFGAPIYVRHEVVHNRFVVDNLKKRGAIFLEDIAEVPDNAIVIFSAHGVSQAVRQEVLSRKLQFFDATCPLVTKVHMEVARLSKQNQECILIGHAGHPEVEGTIGQYHSQEGGIYLVERVEDIPALKLKNPESVAFVTQTTLSVDETKVIIAALKAKFPHISGPKRDDICYATQNRQDAVSLLAKQTDIILVVGSKSSSNSNRLRELAEQLGVEAHLIDDPSQINKAWFDKKLKIGVTAGASAPEILVQDIIAHLRSQVRCEDPKSLEGIQENMLFALPKELR